MRRRLTVAARIGIIAISVPFLSGCPALLGGSEEGASGNGGGSGDGGKSVLTVDTPIIAPSSGTFFQSVDVGISSAFSGAQIYYTLDGSEPEIGSNYYPGYEFTLGPGTTTVRARARDSAGEAETSEIAEATFVVSPGVIVTNGNSSGAGSLAQALAEAVEGTEIRFDGDYTITVDEISQSNPGGIDGFRVTKDLTINGVGHDVVLLGRPDHRIVTIDGATSVTLKNLTLRNGDQSSQGRDRGGAVMVPTGAHLTVENVLFRDNEASSNGGALWLQSDSEATVEDSEFRSNEVGSQGGAVFVGTGSHLTIRNTTFTENATSYTLATGGPMGGGAIAFGNSGTGRIESSRFEQNESAQWGGALSITNGSSVDIVDTEFLLNSAGVAETEAGNYGGGGINVGTNSTARIAGSYFERNKATHASHNDRTGGAIRNQGTLLSYGNTFNGNIAGGAGGAIYAGSNADALTVSSSSFAGNDVEPSGQPGGAIHAEATTNVILYSSFAYNGTNSGVGGIYVPDTGKTAEVRYSAFKFGQMNPTTFDTITSVVAPGTLSHAEVSDEDPDFTLIPDPGNDNAFGTADDSYGDLRPAAGSPLLGGASSSFLLDDATDLDGDGDTTEDEPYDAAGADRVIGTMEIGAYEVTN